MQHLNKKQTVDSWQKACSGTPQHSGTAVKLFAYLWDAHTYSHNLDILSSPPEKKNQGVPCKEAASLSPTVSDAQSLDLLSYHSVFLTSVKICKNATSTKAYRLLPSRQLP